MNIKYLSALRSGATPLAMGFALISTAAFAQDAATTSAPQSVDCSTTPDDPSCGDAQTIVVTGSILRRTDTETVSPVTTVTQENLDQRGISTVQEGLQSLAANNGPALTNSFTANGAFAAGASAISLRGLSTNSTLVLFDGMRAAYYPLADDGSRNFVDLNTIPDDIVERTQILRDGASAAYGADAIAGVVNIITKREFKGVRARGEAGISDRGDASQYRLSLTAGTGDIEEDGYNAYVSGFYYKSNKLMNRDRPYPFNTDDLRGVCPPGDGECGSDDRINSPTAAGYTGAGGPLIVRPYDPTNTTALGRFQLLNNVGCDSAYNLTPAQIADPDNAAAPLQTCTIDLTRKYGVIQPEIERWGVSARVTAKLTDSIEGYAEFNFIQSRSSYESLPEAIARNANAGILFPGFSTSNNSASRAPGSFALTLPVYVCANGVGDASGLNTGCNATNGTLNPNNPFAANGQLARIQGRLFDQATFNETRNRAYRGAIGIKGDLTDNINFDFGATAMHDDLRRTQKGYVYIANLLTAIARGTYNFVDPTQNTQAQNDFLRPTQVLNATSDQVQFQGTLGADLFDLPGGKLQVAVGAGARYEAVDAPSGNPDYFGPTQRYFTLNAFGTKGSRWVYSGFAEINAPIVDKVEINLAGRYDKYSSGQNAFSPKAGIKFKPIDELLIRGTWSKGFRIPSFGEANALPTTGFVTNGAGIFNDAYLAQYGCNTGATTDANPNGYSTCPTYIRSGSYGQTTLASPNLKPERSRSFTAGFVFEPVRNFTLSVDYYNIKKTGVITQPSNSPALEAYYTGQPIPAGYTVIADAPSPDFPNATPRIAFIQSQLINANTQTVSGLDFQIDGKLNLTDNIRFISHLEASYIIKLESDLTNSGGGLERYDGTLGNFNLTAGSGTPKWHGYWLNGLQFDDNFEVNTTVNYFGGYNLSAMDQGDLYKDCGQNPGYSPSGCNVPRYITFDLQTRFKVNDRFTLSLTALNLFDKMPPVDVVTYGAHLYNPIQGGQGILGRYFKVGFQADF
ncbi:MAG: TonB-dependent receptor domain-containing protein [Novosphingobium sp.]